MELEVLVQAVDGDCELQQTDPSSILMLKLNGFCCCHWFNPGFSFYIFHSNYLKLSVSTTCGSGSNFCWCSCGWVIYCQ